MFFNRLVRISAGTLDANTISGYLLSMDVLSQFHPLVREWFFQRFASPTPVQERAWTAIAGGRHVLITAPTGSGKTLAAFLWALNGLISGRLEGGRIRVLYISPLKALNNDIQKNLSQPLAEIAALFRDRGQAFPAIRAQTRSGDTPPSERRTLRTRPPEILITTPESLNILLTSPGASLLFGALSVVILDEIHAVLESKRGTHLIAAVERLTRYAGEFQRVSLSATVRPLEAVAAFTGGLEPSPGGSGFRPRTVEIVQDASQKKYELTVAAPFRLDEESASSESWWGPLVALCRSIIEKNRSTLFFASSRKKTEKLARLINEAGPEILAYSHHGALSKEIRLAVEEQLKAGKLKAIVATGTLELGIDIGELDEVVLVQSPASVSQAIQRIGRAGHQVAGLSRATLVPLAGVDFIHLGALTRAVTDHAIETTVPLECPLDVLAQIVLSLTCSETWNIDALYSFVRTMYPYRLLTRAHFDRVIDLLAGRYAETNIRELAPRVVVDAADRTVTARSGARFLLYLAGGTIPDRGYYELRRADSGAKIGELDEEFVWERNAGDTFVFGPSTWRIQRITASAVEASPQPDAMAMAPFYKAEEQNRSFHFSELIGSFLERANDVLARPELLEEMLRREYAFGDGAAAALVDFLSRQAAATRQALPHRRHIVIEHCRVPLSETPIEIAILHTFWGGRVNKPLADAFAFLWEDRYHYPLEHYSNNDAILFHLPHDFSASLFKEILCSPDLVPALLKRITQTNAFGALFRENAGRALLLPKARPNRRMPFWLTRLRAKNLLAAVLRFPDFPLLTETANNLRDTYYDLPSLALVVEEIRNGRIAVSETTTNRPSPFSEEIVWRMTNQYMYESDELKAHEVRPWQTEERLLFDPRLLSAVSPAAAALLEQKLKRLHPGYAPADPNELFLLVKERLAIPDGEWRALEEAVGREAAAPWEELTAPKKEKIVSLTLPRARLAFVTLVENLPFLCLSFGLDPAALNCRTLDGADVPAAVLERELKKLARTADDELAGEPVSLEIRSAAFLSQFLRYYGPIAPSLLSSLFGLEDRFLEAGVNALLEDEKIVYGRLLEGDTQLLLCDRENYGRLLRSGRRARQQAAPLLDLEYLPLFLAARQNLLRPSADQEALPRALESLIGWTANAAAWEEYLLPARVSGYAPQALDSLLSRTNLVWTGAGKGKIHFAFPEDLPLLQTEKRKGDPDLASLFPHERGRYALEDLVVLAKKNPAALQEALWRGVWSGEASNTAFETLRQALALDFKFEAEDAKPEKKPKAKPNLHSRWTPRLASAGYWFPLSPAGESGGRAADPVESLEEDKERVRLLLDRYGCLFRELLVHEAPAFQWKRLFPVLRVMELSGEIVGGCFWKGVPGLQFMSEEAFAHAELIAREEAVFWMNACDPASPCGKSLPAWKGLFSDRLGSTFLVFRGRALALTVKRLGAELEFKTGPDDPALPKYCEVFRFLISRTVNPLKNVKVVKINREAALKSPYREALIACGFQDEYKALVLRKKY